MSSSKSKSSSSSKVTKDPAPGFNLGQYGSFSKDAKSNNFNYNPTFSPDFLTGQASAQSGLSSVLGNLPTDYSFGDAYDNPYYGDYKNLLQTPITQRYQTNKKELGNTLSARNQIGSSYDAYANSLADRDYNTQLNTADSQARLGSADAFDKYIGNKLNLATTLSNLGSAYQNQYLSPLQIALSGLSANSPYVGGTSKSSSTQTNSPGLLDTYLKFISPVQQASQSALPFLV